MKDERRLARITRISIQDPPEGDIMVELEFRDENGGRCLVLSETVRRRNPTLAGITDVARGQAADYLERIATYLRDVENWRDPSSELPSSRR